MKYYYHVTDISNLKPILKDGLKAGVDGIFLIDSTDLNLIRNVSMNQLFIHDAALLKIDVKGINSAIKQDNVAEFLAGHQFYIEQELIASEYIEFVREYHFTDRDAAELQLEVLRKLGIDCTIEDVLGQMKYIKEFRKKK